MRVAAIDTTRRRAHPPAPVLIPRLMSVAAPATAATTSEGLQVPHGGKLVHLMVPEAQRAAVAASATKKMDLSDRNACDVELLCVGCGGGGGDKGARAAAGWCIEQARAPQQDDDPLRQEHRPRRPSPPPCPARSGFSPLEHFMDKAEYDSVVKDMRLPNGLLFGLPIVLDTNREDIAVGDKVRAHTGTGRLGGRAEAHTSQQQPWAKPHTLTALLPLSPPPQVLVQYQGQDLAVVTISDKWVPNKPLECLKCYGTSSLEHPAVQMVAMERGKYYLGEWHRRRGITAVKGGWSVARLQCSPPPPRHGAFCSAAAPPQHACPFPSPPHRRQGAGPDAAHARLPVRHARRGAVHAAAQHRRAGVPVPQPHPPRPL